MIKKVKKTVKKNPDEPTVVQPDCSISGTNQRAGWLRLNRPVWSGF